MEFSRKHGRITFLADAQVHSPKQGISFEGSITTLGRQGLGMFSQGFLETNSPVEILVTFKDSKGALHKERVQGRVTGVKIGVEGNTFGVEFNEKIRQEQNPALYHYLHQAQTRIS